MSNPEEEQLAAQSEESKTRFFEAPRRSEGELEERLKSVIAVLVPRGLLLPGETLSVAVSGPGIQGVLDEIISQKHLVALPRLAPRAKWPAPMQIDAICGVGELVRIKREAKDEYTLGIRGVARMKVAEELESHQGFCRVRGELIHNVWPEGGPESLSSKASELRDMLYRLCAVRPGPAANVLAGMVAKLSCPAELADLGCAVSLFTQGARIRALDTCEVSKRLDLATESLENLLKREWKAGKWQMN